MKEDNIDVGRVCVTGGTSFVASWLIMRLLQRGYYVNTTIRSSPQGGNKDISYLKNLTSASEKLQIFNADLGIPDSFSEAIKGCVGVFHVAHPIDFEGKETEELMNKKSIDGVIGILQSCIDSKTVKRVIYTSSAASVMFSNSRDGLHIVDENSWSDLDYVRKLNNIASSYLISKTVTEKAALEFAANNFLDLVTVIPTWINGPFITPTVPGSVRSSLAMIFGNKYRMLLPENIPFVDVDDVVRAHIFLFEHPGTKGRYICSALEIENEKLSEFIGLRYPQYPIISTDSSGNEALKFDKLSSKKLLDTGFKFKYGLEDMFDRAIECCQKKSFL